ncbi:hypothetical protein [Geomonas subterranea]|uniref:hypothetical protein n=1 Tax=Geomonas subterranea TaxID=2847989 RepID=UPI001CD7948C|nr:hypothetical protein [Geomonas fuzhouensis]
MAAKNPLLVDIFDYGTPKSCSGEVAELLAVGRKLQRLQAAAKKTLHQKDSTNTKPFLWS